MMIIAVMRIIEIRLICKMESAVNVDIRSNKEENVGATNSLFRHDPPFVFKTSY